MPEKNFVFPVMAPGVDKSTFGDEWYEKFLDAPYDAIAMLPPEKLSVATIDFLVSRPRMYDVRHNAVCSRRSTKTLVDIIDNLFPEENISDYAILTMLGANPAHPDLGLFTVAKSKKITARMTTDIAYAAFVVAAKRSVAGYSSLGVQSFPRSLVTRELVDMALPEYSYQVLGVLPKYMTDEDIFVKALEYNPACLPRVPLHLRTKEQAEISLRWSAANDDVSDNLLRSVINAVPVLDDISDDVLCDVVTHRPQVVNTILHHLPEPNYEALLAAAVKNDDVKNVMKAVNALPEDIVVEYLRKGVVAMSR